MSYDNAGRILNFGSLEVQVVYISGNIRRAFEYYMEDPKSRADMNWMGQRHYPRPDYLSSSRKRLAPQLIYKGGILHAWGKKQAVAVDKHFFNSLPTMEEVDPVDAEMAWLVYDLQFDSLQNRFQLARFKTVYTLFNTTLEKITKAESGDIQGFIGHLQDKLDEKLEFGSSPDAPSLTDITDL